MASTTQVRQERATIVARHEREWATLSRRHFAELLAFDAATREDKTSRAGSNCKACGEVVGTDFKYCMDDGCDVILCLREECIETHVTARRLYNCEVCSKSSCYVHLLDSYCRDCEKYADQYQCCDLRDNRCNSCWENHQQDKLDQKRARYDYNYWRISVGLPTSTRVGVSA